MLLGIETIVTHCVGVHSANDQHNLSAAISDDPEDTSFRGAMKLSVGTLLVLDSEAMPFSRI